MMIAFEINYYVNLLRIKKEECGNNAELDYQIRVQESKLRAFGIDTNKFKI